MISACFPQKHPYGLNHTDVFLRPQHPGTQQRRHQGGQQPLHRLSRHAGCRGQAAVPQHRHGLAVDGYAAPAGQARCHHEPGGVIGQPGRGGKKFQQAASAAKAGDYTAVQAILRPVLEGGQGEALARKLQERFG